MFSQKDADTMRGMSEWINCLESATDPFTGHIEEDNRLWHLVRWIRTEQADRTPFETVAAYFLPSGVHVIDCGTWWTDAEADAWAATTTRRTRREGKRPSVQPPVGKPAAKRARKESNKTSAAKATSRRPQAKRTPKQDETRPPNPFVELNLDNVTYGEAQALMEQSELFMYFVSGAFTCREYDRMIRLISQMCLRGPNMCNRCRAEDRPFCARRDMLTACGRCARAKKVCDANGEALPQGGNRATGELVEHGN